MYHVPKDKRSERSCEKICEATLSLLREKDPDRISIAAICDAAGTSRATFYRLFDRVEDVLPYRCDAVYGRIAEEMQAGHVRNTKDLVICFIRVWLEQEELLDALDRSNMLSIVYESKLSHAKLLELSFNSAELSPEAFDYFVSIQTTAMPAVLQMWIEHGRKETPEEVYERVAEALNALARHLPA